MAQQPPPALTVQERTGSRWGQILRAEGLVDRLDPYRVLATRWNLELVDVAHTCDGGPSLLRPEGATDQEVERPAPSIRE